MKNITDNLLLCNLYQIKEERGYYINRKEIHGKYDINIGLESMYGVNKICSVIVEKNIFSKYNLREIITNIPIDTIYDVDNEFCSVDWLKHTVKGNKNEYDTFILVPLEQKEITADKLEEYINEHSDVEKFKADLEELLKKGKNNHVNMKNIKMEKNKEEEKRVQSLLKRVKKRRK